MIRRLSTMLAATAVLLRRIRKDAIPDLALRNVGCSGETSRSLITSERSPCRYPAGSQLQAASTS